MLQLQNITKSYQDNIVLDNISLSVNAHELIAIIGSNGAGKTTLLKLLLGEINPDSGTVINRNESVGYVPQEPENVDKSIEKCFGEVEPWRIDHVLSLVDLSSIDHGRIVDSLSGGQKTRLAIAQVLAHDPESSVLLLDEPTNNLDAEGLDWLKSFIRKFDGAVLVVSHDRHFINTVATKIIELRKGNLKQYGGNYDFYLDQRNIERQALQAHYEQGQEEKKRLQKAITLQNEKSQHTHRHIKRSDNDKYQRDFFRNRVTVKFGQQSKNLQSRLEQLEEVDQPDIDKVYSLKIDGNVASHKLLIRLNDISYRFDKKEVLKDIDLEIRGNERWHVQGRNGSGKSTLLKLAARQLTSQVGTITYYTNVNIGYFSQDVNGIDYKLSGLANLETTEAPKERIFRQARSLGLLPEDLRRLPIELSRGQQAKLSFAKLLLSRNDLLILDEPTNHLDISTKESLEQAIQQYTGALLVASHDKYFLRQVGVQRTINLDEESK